MHLFSEQVDTINDLQAKIREMSLEMDKYKFQIEGLHRELKESAKDNKYELGARSFL